MHDLIGLVVRKLHCHELIVRVSFIENRFLCDEFDSAEGEVNGEVNGRKAQTRQDEEYDGECIVRGDIGETASEYGELLKHDMGPQDDQVI